MKFIVEVCFVCGSNNWSNQVKTKFISVRRCAECGIHLCDHLNQDSLRTDYDQNWQQSSPEYLKSLESLRQIQAKRIATKLIELFGRPEKWCDFGTGRGWFPKILKQMGLYSVVGVDASAQALEYLKAEKIETAVIDDFSKLPAVVPSITGLSLLDVLEHFKGEDMHKFLRLLSSQSQLSYLVIKVPTNNGFFYRSALFVAKLKLVSPIETLYQVGTFPPHEVYFSEPSLVKLISSYGYELIAKQSDLDFEPHLLFSRIFKKAFPIPWVSGWIGNFLAFIIQWIHSEDSMIFYFKRIPQ